jgi:tetratricopeptide (TPR) repeat protein
MFQLKPITTAGIPAALQKAERYRLLNDPSAAESICLDIVDIDPDNQQALVMLLLARTDQFDATMAAGAAKAREVLPRLRDTYKREYYGGVIHERRAKAILHAGRPGNSAMAYDAFREALECYERAERLGPAGSDEARLRWNTCARILNGTPHLSPRGEERFEPILEE